MNVLGLLHALGMFLLLGAFDSDFLILAVAESIHTQSAVLFSAHWIQWSFIPMFIGFGIVVVNHALAK